MTGPRGTRADAVRNRSRILAAAREQLSANGSDAGMDRIAQSAGVAVGTLYRHFPTKTDLVAAIIAEHVAQVADDAEAAWGRVRSGAPALEELVGFVERVLVATGHNQAAKVVARGLGIPGLGEPADEKRAQEAIRAVVEAAQRAGDLRPDLTVADLYLLMATAPMDQPEISQRRWLTLVLDGLLT